MNQESDIDGERYALAFETVQASLLAENWFFEQVRAKLAETAALTDFPTVTGPNGHDHLLHFTQFLFFLKALDCTSAEQIGTFIDTHNAKIEDDLADPAFSKSRNEVKKAVVNKDRKAKIVDTVRAFGRPVFAIYEYGHFLIDNMSPKTTEKLIEDLRFGKLLTQRTDNRIDADQKRVLIESTGMLERTYSQSLLMQRRMIAATMGAAEFEAARVEEG